MPDVKTDWAKIATSREWADFWLSSPVNVRRETILRQLREDDSLDVRGVERLRGELRMLEWLRSLPESYARAQERASNYAQQDAAREATATPQAASSAYPGFQEG